MAARSNGIAQEEQGEQTERIVNTFSSYLTYLFICNCDSKENLNSVRERRSESWENIFHNISVNKGAVDKLRQVAIRVWGCVGDAERKTFPARYHFCFVNGSLRGKIGKIWETGVGIVQIRCLGSDDNV